MSTTTWFDGENIKQILVEKRPLSGAMLMVKELPMSYVG